MSELVDNEESKGFTQADYSLFNTDFEAEESDDDAKTKIVKRQLNHLEQLYNKKQAQTKQVKKSAAKDKARRDKYIALMQSMQEFQRDIAKEEEELARIQADSRQAEEEDYMDALAKVSMLDQQ